MSFYHYIYSLKLGLPKTSVYIYPKTSVYIYL